ncbi:MULTISPECIES: hypothetical protein [Pseudomonas]
MFTSSLESATRAATEIDRGHVWIIRPDQRQCRSSI